MCEAKGIQPKIYIKQKAAGVAVPATPSSSGSKFPLGLRDQKISAGMNSADARKSLLARKKTVEIVSS